MSFLQHSRSNHIYPIHCHHKIHDKSTPKAATIWATTVLVWRMTNWLNHWPA